MYNSPWNVRQHSRVTVESYNSQVLWFCFAIGATAWNFHLSWREGLQRLRGMTRYFKYRLYPTIEYWHARFSFYCLREKTLSSTFSMLKTLGHEEEWGPIGERSKMRGVSYQQNLRYWPTLTARAHCEKFLYILCGSTRFPICVYQTQWFGERLQPSLLATLQSRVFRG